MAASTLLSSLLLPVGFTYGRSLSANAKGTSFDKVQDFVVRCSGPCVKVTASRTRKHEDDSCLIKRRDVIALVFGISGLLTDKFDARGAGLPPEQKTRLCDDTCEKEIENVPMVTTESGLRYKDIKVGGGPSPPVGFQRTPTAISRISVEEAVTNSKYKVAANYVAMVPSGQIFDSSLEKGQPYIFRVGSGQVIKGLDEGILSMKVGGKRRLYIPGSLAFPKGLNSAPGRPRVAPSSPVIFDVSLEYIPGLEAEEE